MPNDDAKDKPPTQPSIEKQPSQDPKAEPAPEFDLRRIIWDKIGTFTVRTIKPLDGE